MDQAGTVTGGNFCGGSVDVLEKLEPALAAVHEEAKGKSASSMVKKARKEHKTLYSLPDAEEVDIARLKRIFDLIRGGNHERLTLEDLKKIYEARENFQKTFTLDEQLDADLVTPLSEETKQKVAEAIEAVAQFAGHFKEELGALQRRQEESQARADALLTMLQKDAEAQKTLPFNYAQILRIIGSDGINSLRPDVAADLHTKGLLFLSNHRVKQEEPTAFSTAAVQFIRDFTPDLVALDNTEPDLREVPWKNDKDEPSRRAR